MKKTSTAIPSYAQVSRIVQDVLGLTGLPYELLGLDRPADPSAIWELTFLDPDAPPWARTFQLPIQWSADTSRSEAAATLEMLLRERARHAKNDGGRSA